MQWCDLESCVRWMTPYAQILREEPCPSQIMAIANGQEGTGAPSKSSSDPATHDDEHTIQIHTVNLEILVSQNERINIIKGGKLKFDCGFYHYNEVLLYLSAIVNKINVSH